MSGFNWLQRAAFVMSALILLLAVIGPLIVPHDPIVPDPIARLLPPSAEHWFGTDHLGRDVFSRVLAGAQISIGLAVLVVLISALAGLIIGLAAGAGGRWADAALMRLTDAFFAFPELIAALAVAGVLVRGMTLATAASDHVALAKLSGVSALRIARDHLTPPVLPAMIVMMTAHLARAILAISGLGFLGFGAAPPTPEWGVILLEARVYILSAPLYAILPGLPIVVSVLAFNLAGDALRDRIGTVDPR